ncbi:DUF3103 family protein [Actinophytocola sp.]|uniref:DUF3103 family protein n=1 Tax=Actinophytocola sp. TaxID=1872138 RepID=UPI0025BEC26E|nr:DUF3103 family protein [Actinophytocola sp.]
MAVALASSTVPVQAEPGSGAHTGVSAAGTVAAITDRLARQLAAPLAGDARRAGLFSATEAAATGTALSGAAASPALDGALRQANRDVLAAKGLPADGPSLLRLRLAHPDMRAALSRGEAPLVAAAPADDVATTVTAYAGDGAKVLLDARKVPRQPVFVVEVDTAKALPLGLDVLRSVLDRHGITGAQPAADGGYWATQVRSVRLNDDKEPWIKGDAEIFGITGGFGLDGKVAVDTVTMPYLDNDGTTYYPNQLIVHFSAYKYNLADFVMMEDDGDTNYQSLAVALASALLTIVDGGAYVPLVNAILNAIPASWWTDDPDYVDSWYTLSTATGGQLNGAAGNGSMSLAPYWVAPL